MNFGTLFLKQVTSNRWTSSKTNRRYCVGFVAAAMRLCVTSFVTKNTNADRSQRSPAVSANFGSEGTNIPNAITFGFRFGSFMNTDTPIYLS